MNNKSQEQEYLVPADPIIQIGEFGQWINTKRPPDFAKNGNQWEGYPDWNHKALYQDFCVGAREIEIIYKGTLFLFEEDETGVHQCKESFGIPIGPNYTCGNDFLDNYRFPDGKSIPEVIDELEVELW